VRGHAGAAANKELELTKPAFFSVCAGFAASTPVFGVYGASLRTVRVSQAASQYAAFWRDVKRSRKVWTVRDDNGYPAPRTRTGQRAMPFWSTLSRVQRIIKTVSAYRQFNPEELSWETFRDKWLPELEANGCLVGVNWSGRKALGYDMAPADIRSAGAAIVDASPTAGGTPPGSPPDGA